MTRFAFAFAALMLALACGDDSTDTTGSTMDSGPSDAFEPADLGPEALTVSVETIVAASGENNVGQWGPLPILPAAPSNFFTFGVNSLRQPSGPDLRDLEFDRLGIALGTASGSADWLAASEGARLLSLEGDEAWMYFRGDEPHRINTEPVAADELVRLSVGSIEQRVALPAGFDEGLLVEDMEGARWLLGNAPGTSTVDGSALGDAADEQVVFLARIGVAGLTDVQRVAAGAVYRSEAVALPDGDLLFIFGWTGPGTLAGETLADTGRVLVRFDPDMGRVANRWPVTPERRVSLRPTATGVEIRGKVRHGGPPLVIGDSIYEALEPPEPFTETSTTVQISWDGTGELPTGTRWPVDAHFTEGGIAIGQRNHLAFVRLDERGQVARWVGGTLESLDPSGVFRLDDRIWVTVGSRSGRAQELYNATPEGFATIALEPAAEGSGTLWLLELSAESGEVLRQVAIDLGPEIDEVPVGFAQPIDGEHFLVSVKRGGSEVAEVWVEGWDGARTPLPLTAECESRTVASVQGLPEQFPNLPFPVDLSLFNLLVVCEDGPHSAFLGDQGFEHEEARSSTLYRISVE